MATVLPELDVEKVERWYENRVPARARDQIRLEVTTRGKTLSIFERRPHWQGKPVEWSKTRIIQIRYEGDGTWTLYFGDRYGKWTMYSDLDSHQPIDVIIKEFEEDPPASSGADPGTVARAYDHVRPKLIPPPLGGRHLRACGVLD